jgi:hypothetical protein
MIAKPVAFIAAAIPQVGSLWFTFKPQRTELQAHAPVAGLSKPTIFLGLTSLFGMLYLRYKQQMNGRVERGERLTDLVLT